jgi:hypothetical protein
MPTSPRQQGQETPRDHGPIDLANVAVRTPVDAKRCADDDAAPPNTPPGCEPATARSASCVRTLETPDQDQTDVHNDDRTPSNQTPGRSTQSQGQRVPPIHSSFSGRKVAAPAGDGLEVCAESLRRCHLRRRAGLRPRCRGSESIRRAVRRFRAAGLSGTRPLLRASSSVLLTRQPGSGQRYAKAQRAATVGTRARVDRLQPETLCRPARVCLRTATCEGGPCSDGPGSATQVPVGGSTHMTSSVHS